MTSHSQIPEKVERVGRHVRAWRKLASVLRAISNPALTYHAVRLRRNEGQSKSDHVYVCGIPRAGTSLIATILMAHGEFASMGQENDFFVRRNFAGLKISDLDAATLQSMGEKSATRAELFDRIAATYTARNPGTTRYLDKSPGNILHYERIARMFPRARFIVLIRDPRDAFISFNRHPGLVARPLARYCELWNQFAGKIASAVEEDAFMLVKYEELCREPERAAKAICSHLGIAFKPAMLSPEAQAANRGAYGGGSGHERIGQPITPKSVGAWRDKLTPDEAEAIASQCAEGMQHFGYSD